MPTDIYQKKAISFLRRITDKPQEDLLEYVLTNNLDEIERLLLLYPELKTHRYYDYNEKTILHIACCDYADDITHITVSFLIELGCDLDYDDDYGFRALHYAVVGQNVDVLELILQESENPSSFTMGGDTALHLLIDTGPRNNRGDFLKCIDLLRQKIDINVLNNLFESAIYKAVKKDDQEVVELLLNCDGIQIDVEINIKQLNWHKKKARYLIKDASRVKIDEDVVELCSLIDQRDETQFLYLLLKLNEKKYYNLVPYFIKKACYEKQLEIIKYFTSIERTPDMVARFSMRTPLRVAVMDGLHEVMGYILDISKSRDEMDVEVELMQRKKRNSSIKNYDKCLDIYLKKCPNMLDPNHERTKGNYILQRCIKFNQHEAVLYLLKHGASLANNDEQGNITMEGIPFDILEEHFDSCINIESKGFTEKVVFDYKSFMPTDGPSIQLDLESGSRNMQLKPEMNALLYMTESLELKTLLKHPLIMSYVYLQWDRVKWFHHINLIVYVFFASTIILCLRPFDLSQKLPNPDIALVLLLLFFDIVFFMKEVFQIFVFRLNYFKYFENYIELSLALSVVALIGYYFSNSPPPDELKACVILLLGFGFLFLLGSHPKLSTTIAMFRKVSYEYVQFLIFYITIIISFAISFYTIFRNDSAEVSFTNPLTAVFKTFIMMTGEYEAGELDFQVHTFLTYIIYATFVFSNGIVLLNLLNSLAISDVQKIKNEAELWSLKATIKYIGAIESLVFNEFQSNSYRNLIMQYVGKLYLKNKPDYELLIGRKIEKRHYGGILDIAIVHEAVEIAKKRQRQNENINETS